MLCLVIAVLKHASFSKCGNSAVMISCHLLLWKTAVVKYCIIWGKFYCTYSCSQSARLSTDSWWANVNPVFPKQQGSYCFVKEDNIGGSQIFMYLNEPLFSWPTEQGYYTEQETSWVINSFWSPDRLNIDSHGCDFIDMRAPVKSWCWLPARSWSNFSCPLFSLFRWFVLVADNHVIPQNWEV